MEFHGDVYGRLFDKEFGITARKFEMDFVKKMKVHSKVERAIAKNLGAKIITTHWIDTNKCYEVNFDYRVRFVRRDINIDQRPELFVAICVLHQYGNEPYRIFSNDVKRAYLFAKTKRPIFIEIFIEDRLPGDADMVGRLNFSFYGARDAAVNWQDEFNSSFIKNDFLRGKASLCKLQHPQRNLCVTIHDGDFTSIGPKRQLMR